MNEKDSVVLCLVGVGEGGACKLQAEVNSLFKVYVGIL